MSGSPVRCARSKDDEPGGDDAQPVDVIGEQLQVQAYPAHVLRLVDDQRPATADEGAQSGQRLALEILPHVDVLAGDEQGVRIVLPHVPADQGGLPDAPGTVDDDHPSGRDRAREPRELSLLNVIHAYVLN